MSEPANYCVIIPGFNEAGRIASLVKNTLSHGCDVVFVDDGSSDASAKEAEGAGAIVLRHDENRGKGVALETGFRYAREKKYEFAVTMDADGQHDPNDIPAMIRAHREDGFPVVIGSRMWDARKMPPVRRLTNLCMSWLLNREMGQNVPDTQSGYRLYGCAVLELLKVESSRFAAESEVLLRLAEEGIRIGSSKIRVIYSDEKSRIHPFRDALLFFSMLREHRMKKRARCVAEGRKRGVTQ